MAMWVVELRKFLLAFGEQVERSGKITHILRERGEQEALLELVGGQALRGVMAVRAQVGL